VKGFFCVFGFVFVVELHEGVGSLLEGRGQVTRDWGERRAATRERTVFLWGDGRKAVSGRL